MLRRLTISVLLVMALILVPLRSPAQDCAMSKPATMSCTACCAMMKSCVLPQRNPTNVVTIESSNQFAFTATPPLTPVLLHELFATPFSYALAETPRAAHTPARLAVLCTFLI